MSTVENLFAPLVTRETCTDLSRMLAIRHGGIIGTIDSQHRTVEGMTGEHNA